MIMEFSVTKRGGSFITPSGHTPIDVLDLSVIDNLAVLRCNARTLHVFKGGNGSVIREAFSKALVPYYPLAGRLKNEQQHLQIDCSGQGIWFEEAFADCTLHDVNFLDNEADYSAYSEATFDKLLPQHHSSPPPVGHDTFMDPLVLVQVNNWSTFCHSICDGLGAAQFLNAVGEFARGVDKLSVSPVWCREYLLPPAQVQQQKEISADRETKDNSMSPPLIPVPDQRLEHASFDIPMNEISQLKHKVMQELLDDLQAGSGGAKGHENQNASCSSFEIIAATLWRQRSRAILDLTNDKTSNNLNISTNCADTCTDNDEVKLLFFANCRQLVPLPDGFYGNCFFPVTVKAPNKMVAQASLAEVVKLIQDAKAKLPAEFSIWLKNTYKKFISEYSNCDDQNGDGDEYDDPFAPGPGVGYNTLFISEWGRLGFNEVDYGWGKPVHVIPVQGSPVIPVGIVSKQPLPDIGIRLMTWCVHSNHLPTFLDMMKRG